MRALHGWSKATISSAVTLYFLTSGIMGLMIGRNIDRYHFSANISEDPEPLLP
jgi:hypothetical protein